MVVVDITNIVNSEIHFNLNGHYIELSICSGAWVYRYWLTIDYRYYPFEYGKDLIFVLKKLEEGDEWLQLMLSLIGLLRAIEVKLKYTKMVDEAYSNKKNFERKLLNSLFISVMVTKDLDRAREIAELINSRLHLFEDKISASKYIRKFREADIRVIANALHKPIDVYL